MKILKLFIAFAMYTTSMTFSDQVLVTNSGLVSSWDVQIEVSKSQALYNYSLEFE